MRIIKLSKDEFPALSDVRDFFGGLPQRNPPGKFRLPKGWIASDALDVGEQLVFTYDACPVYTATVESGIQTNVDEYSPEYPIFFQIDLSTWKEVEDAPAKRDILRDLAKGQGWNRLEDSGATQAAWTALR